MASKLPTPVYSHISQGKFSDVYEPREDTFLLLDALEEDLDQIVGMDPRLVVEIGSGSGINIVALARVFGPAVLCSATDINPNACLATLETSRANGAHVECLNMNLLDFFKPGSCDVIIFNPPYVATEEAEMDGHGLERSWAGGDRGRSVIDKLLPRISNLLTDAGACYMVLLKDNNVMEVCQAMTQFGFDCSVLKERKIPAEHLYVLKFIKAQRKACFWFFFRACKSSGNSSRSSGFNSDKQRIVEVFRK